MNRLELLTLVTAVLFRPRDTNPPHGVYETREQTVARAMAEAEVLMRVVAAHAGGSDR